MKNQKTVAKWLGAIVALTLAVTAYVFYDALYLRNRQTASGGNGEKIAVSNGEQSGDDNANGSGKGDGASGNDADETPKIQYSVLPRQNGVANGLSVQHVGSSGDDAFLSALKWGDKYFAVVKSGASDNDFEKSNTLYLCAFAYDKLMSVTPLGDENDTYLDMKITASGLCIVTSGNQKGNVCTFDKDGTKIAQSDIEKCASAKIYAESGASALFVAGDKNVEHYALQKNGTLNKSAYVYAVGGMKIYDAFKGGNTYQIVCNNASGYVILLTFDPDSGFDIVNTLSKLEINQFLAFDTPDGARKLIAGTNAQNKAQVYVLDNSLLSLFTRELDTEFAPNGRYFATENNLIYLCNKKVLKLCFHLDIVDRLDTSYGVGKICSALQSSVNENNYVVTNVKDGFAEIAIFDTVTFLASAKYAYSASAQTTKTIATNDGFCLFFTSESDTLFGNVNFGGGECFAVFGNGIAL